MPEQNAKLVSTTIENPDQWLWLDPFDSVNELKGRLSPGAVLLAEDIAQYVETYNVLIAREDFRDGSACGAKLKGASYTMTPDPQEAWMFNQAGELVLLEKGSDLSQEPYYVVPHHSLVYVKLRQRLRVPFYLIGRHNLKISYVYQGLLLGTGPQVDPGYVGNLIIPLHNFTTQDVNVFINRSFVSIDFVRTSPLTFAKGVPQTIDALYKTYGSEKCLIERPKVTDRVHLRDYLHSLKPRSAMAEILRNLQATAEDLRQLKGDATTSIRNLKEANAEFELRVQGDIDQLRDQVRTGSEEQKQAAKELKAELEVANSRIAADVEKSEKAHRIEIFVVAGLLLATVLGIIIPIVCWVRDYYGEFNGRLNGFETKVAQFEVGRATNLVDNVKQETTNVLLSIRRDANMALLPLSAAASVASNTLHDVDSRIKQLEASLQTLSNRVAAANSQPPTPPQK